MNKPRERYRNLNITDRIDRPHPHLTEQIAVELGCRCGGRTKETGRGIPKDVRPASSGRGPMPLAQ